MVPLSLAGAIAGALLVALALPPGPAAAEPAIKANPHRGESRWTEEMYREAVPMPRPAPDAAFVLPLSPAVPGRGVRSPASRPAVEPGGGLEMQLYEPEDEDAAVIDAPLAEDLGPAAIAEDEFRFTQGRVFPGGALRQFPYRMVGKLFIRDDRNRRAFQCSGALIQRRIVITAAHCLYDFDSTPPRFLDDFEFIPAFDRGNAPFGRWDWDRVLVTTSWQNGDGRFPHPGDFGLLVLRNQRVQGRNQSIGDLLGWFGWKTSSAVDEHVTVLDYPGNLDRGERLQRNDAEARANGPFAAEIGTYSDTGSSGGPWVLDFGVAARGQPENGNQVVGVVSYGRGRVGEPQVQGISILNDEFVSLLDQACAVRPANCAR